MNRAPRLPDGPPEIGSQDVFYADPKRPGAGLHSRCFGSGINPKREGYPLHPGPCWKCFFIGQMATNYPICGPKMIAVQNFYVDSLNQASAAAFDLLRALSSDKCFDNRIGREELEHRYPQQMNNLHHRWQEAAEYVGSASFTVDRTANGMTHLVARYLFSKVTIAIPPEDLEAFILRFSPLILDPLDYPFVFDIRPTLANDPSQQAMPLVTLLSDALRLAKCARLAKEEWDLSDELFRLAYGSDPLDIVASMCEEGNSNITKAVKTWVSMSSGSTQLSPQELARVESKVDLVRHRKSRRKHRKR